MNDWTYCEIKDIMAAFGLLPYHAGDFTTEVVRDDEGNVIKRYISRDFASTKPIHQFKKLIDQLKNTWHCKSSTGSTINHAWIASVRVEDSFLILNVIEVVNILNRKEIKCK